MRFRTARRAGVLLASIVAAAALLPGAGQSYVPHESDGSVYTWAGASMMGVDVRPWGGGYVRSTPYLIDCPMACIRPWEQGRDITLTAYATPGHKFESWEGACAGQGNPCTVKVSGGLVDVRAVFSGQFIPPAPPPPPPPPPGPPSPPPPPPPPPVVDPSLSVDVQPGDCDPRCFTMAFSGTGYNPNSAIDITFSYVTPDAGSGTDEDVATGDGSGAWSVGYYEDCNLPTKYSGPVVINVTATDAEGASASTQVNGTCP